MGFTKSLVIACFVCPSIAASATAGERPADDGKSHAGRHAAAHAAAPAVADPLDRVADAVDGVESSHGKDAAMWRLDPAAPQGPMQVSEAAATDIGGGDRFDLAQNRALGRAYLSRLYWRYHNWPDAIAAYNWGIGKVDAWVQAGRPRDKMLAGVAVYLQRVLFDSGLCSGTAIVDPRRAISSAATPDTTARSVAVPPDEIVYTACAAADAAGGPPGFAGGANRFYKQLDAALQIAVRRAAQDR